MKKILYTAMAAALVLTACQKNIAEGPSNQAPVIGEQAVVTFRLASTATKTEEAGLPDESKINSIDAFVFNDDGTLDGYLHQDGTGSTITVEASKGSNKVLVAAVNIPASYKMNEVKVLADLDKVYALTDNKTAEGVLSNFQMFGYLRKDLVSGNNTATINVDRAVAKIHVGEIVRNFTVASLKDQSFEVTNIYVTNAVGSVGLSAPVAAGTGNPTWLYDWQDEKGDGMKYFDDYKDAVSDIWYNKYTPDDDDADAFSTITFDDAAKAWLNASLASPVSYENQTTMAPSVTKSFDKCFYVMPNKTKYADEGNKGFGVEGGAAFAPRWTKLVIETKLAGKTLYYSIPIIQRASYPEGDFQEGILSNHVYKLEKIVLTRPGSEDPDIPVSPAQVEFTISVNPWTIVNLANDDNGYII